MGRVLVVDDSPVVVEVISDALTEAGFDVLSANGITELGELRQRGTLAEVDVLLIDVHMPELFGDDVAQVLATEVGGPTILLFSGIDEPELATRATEAGVAGYVSKAWAEDRIVARVREAAESRRTSAPRAAASEPSAPTAKASAWTQRFLVVAQERIVTIEQAVTRGDREAAAREAHTLAGEAGMVGLAEVQRTARAAEVWLRDAAHDLADAASTLLALRQAIDAQGAGRP